MDLELLRTLLVAVDAPTLTAAAATRHVTKSAISQQLKALEGQIGFPLFDRTGRNVRATPAARRLAESLRGLFAGIDDALAIARSAHVETRGAVRLGAPRPFTTAWLRPRLAGLLREAPGVTLDVVFGGPSELERKLVAREIDLAVLARAPENASVETEVLHVETFVAVASPRYLDEHGTPETAEAFVDQRVLVFDRDLPMHAAWWRAAFGARAPLRGHVAARIASLDELLAMAESGAGIAVLPDYFVERSLAAKRIVALRSKRSAKNAIVLAWRKGAVETAALRTVKDALR